MFIPVTRLLQLIPCPYERYRSPNRLPPTPKKQNSTPINTKYKSSRTARNLLRRCAPAIITVSHSSRARPDGRSLAASLAAHNGCQQKKIHKRQKKKKKKASPAQQADTPKARARESNLYTSAPVQMRHKQQQQQLALACAPARRPLRKGCKAARSSSHRLSRGSKRSLSLRQWARARALVRGCTQASSPYCYHHRPRATTAKNIRYGRARTRGVCRPIDKPERSDRPIIMISRPALRKIATVSRGSRAPAAPPRLIIWRARARAADVSSAFIRSADRPGHRGECARRTKGERDGRRAGRTKSAARARAHHAADCAAEQQPLRPRASCDVCISRSAGCCTCVISR